jgi:hypothetical protein
VADFKFKEEMRKKKIEESDETQGARDRSNQAPSGPGIQGKDARDVPRGPKLET